MTVGAHRGAIARWFFKFLEGRFEGLEGYAVGRMTKSRRGKIYIDDACWGPEAGSIEYGYRVPLVAYTFSSARSVNRALSWTPAPTSSRQLNVRDLPGLNQL
jgi:hypothetical protein